MAQVHQLQPQNTISRVNDAGMTSEINQFKASSLYVGDLDLNVTDSQLYDLFNQVGQVFSVKICKDSTGQRSLGYGYVNFCNAQDGYFMSLYSLFLLFDIYCFSLI